jgi:hypothetical protein
VVGVSGTCSMSLPALKPARETACRQSMNRTSELGDKQL